MAANYRDAYNQLNPAQRQAVDTIEGPVLVVAGPGTGKTQLLSLRVANILTRTDTPASSILCLTFTNFAAANMRARLNNLIGPTAHRVVVRTFHSFAAEIMNQYPDYFWNGAKLSIAPDATQIEIIQSILETLPLDNPLASRFGGTLTAITDVQKQINLTKDAGLTPAKLAAMIAYNEAYIDSIEPELVALLSAPLSAKKLPAVIEAVMALPDHAIAESVKPLRSLSAVLKDSLTAAVASDAGTNKTVATGIWKKRWIQTVQGQKGMFDERRRNGWWSAVANVYADYRDALHVRGYYDYADMIVEVISQLQLQPDLLAGVQERFLYVLVDEFQDTNAAQLQLAHLVATHYSNADQPNLMAVGDDDQSIYAFNGAELNNMLNFSNTYPATKTIVLTENYRSTQQILDTATAIIEQANDRLIYRQPELSKDLRAMSTVAAGVITHLEYPTRDHELFDVAQRIASNWDQNNNDSVAVLARSHDSLRRLSVMLHEQGVPIKYEQQNNILETEIIRLVFSLMQTVAAIADGNERQVNQLLSQLLRYPVWAVAPAELWRLAVDNAASPHWFNSLLEHDNPALVTLAQWLLWLSQLAVPLPLFLEYVLGLRTGEHLTSPIRTFYTTLPVTTEYMEALSAIKLLISLSREFAISESAGPADFSRFIDMNNDLGRAITDQSWYISGERAVELMTVHKSKGLEFDTVYVIDVTEDGWQPRSVSRKPPANLPMQPYGELYDDYVRLLYVAATRARQNLILTSFSSDDQSRLAIASPLVTNAVATETIAGSEVSSPVIILESALRWPRLDSLDEKILLRSRLDNFSLNATGLQSFLNVAKAGPGQFLEQNLLKLPSAGSVTLSFGTAIHASLQYAQQLTNDGKTTILPAVLEHFEAILRSQHLAEAEMERFVPHGQRLLTELFTVRAFTLPMGGLAEVTLNDIYIGDARLGGKLDHVLQTNTALLITDYKTGQPLSNFATRDQSKAIKAWQHRTQLLFYALLASGAARFSSVTTIETRMLYLEAESAQAMSLTLTPTQEAMERIEGLAVAVWQHVNDLNFPDVSAYAADMSGITQFEDDLLAGLI